MGDWSRSERRILRICHRLGESSVEDLPLRCSGEHYTGWGIKRIRGQVIIRFFLNPMLCCPAISSLLHAVPQHLIHPRQRRVQERAGAGAVEGAVERAVEAAFSAASRDEGAGVHAVKAGQPDAELVAREGLRAGDV
jgi:hypothetical protein